MNINPIQKQILKKIKEASVLFIQIAILFLLMLLFLRLVDLILNGIIQGFPKDFDQILFWSLLMDIAFWFKSLFYFYVLYVLLFFVIPKLAKIFSFIFIAIFVITQMVLVQYFNTALVPLGSDLYAYSIADIKQTVGAAGGVDWIDIIVFICIAGIFFMALKYLPKRIKMPVWLAIVLPFIGLLLKLTNAYSYIKPKGFNDFNNNLILNKTDFFLDNSYIHFFPEVIENDIYADSYIGDYDGVESKAVSFKYLDEANFPFLHQDSTQDVLTPFFAPGKKQPNIIIILVEGLGRAFTNEGAYLGNFTPFIDSLSNKSLYWKNFLSEGGRTFAILPSIMGSLPFAKNGFLELGNAMPAHQSLYSLLKYNGYNTSFYYGGDSRFDNMYLFLRKNNVDEIKDEKTFPSGNIKLPSVNGFTWGYNDKDLFSHYINTRNGSLDNAPQLSVILTVSTHNPFIINEQAKYLDRFEQRMNELGFSAATKRMYRNYKLQYASILYLDDALRTFFNEFKKRPDFANTIFIVTGDHRMPEIPMISKIDRYHVPLIIYSQLLNRTAQFASISTHFDITPSLLAYLKSNYQLKVPSVKSWIGNGLDTTRSFRNTHSYPIMQTKADMLDFIMDDYHLNGKTLFKLNANMDETPVDDVNKYNQLKSAFEQFKKRNNNITNGIIPDSLYRNYLPLKK